MNFLKVKAIVIFLSLVLTSSLFATGQAESQQVDADTPQEKVTINWMLFGGLGGVKDRIAILEQTKPEITAKYEIIPTVTDQHEVAQKLRLALAAGGSEIPDIISLSKMELTEFVRAGVIEELTGRLKPYKSDLTDAAWALSTMDDGKLYGVPNQVKPKIWYYRKDIFDEMGISAEKIKTTDDFIAAGKKIQTKYPKANLWNFGPSIGHYNLSMITSGNGARYFDKDGNYIVASDPGVRRAFADMKKMKDAGIIADISDWTPDWEQAFKDGQIVSTLQADWFKLGYLEKWAPDQAGKWAVALWPEIGGASNGGGSDSGGGVMAILKGSKNKEAAFEILAEINLNPDSANLLFQKRNVAPLIKSAYVKYPDLKAPLTFYSNDFWAVSEQALEYYKELPYSANSAKEHNVMNQYLQGYLVGAFTSLDECLKKAEAELNNQIGNAFSN